MPHPEWPTEPSPWDPDRAAEPSSLWDPNSPRPAPPIPTQPDAAARNAADVSGAGAREGDAAPSSIRPYVLSGANDPTLVDAPAPDADGTEADGAEADSAEADGAEADGAAANGAAANGATTAEVAPEAGDDATASGTADAAEDGDAAGGDDRMRAEEQSEAEESARAEESTETEESTDPEPAAASQAIEPMDAAAVAGSDASTAHLAPVDDKTDEDQTDGEPADAASDVKPTGELGAKPTAELGTKPDARPDAKPAAGEPGKKPKGLKPPPGYIPHGNYPPAPEKRGRGVIIALTIVVVILMLSTGGVAYLLHAKSSDYDKQVAVIGQRNTTIAADQAKINQLNTQLQQATAQAQQLQQQLGTQSGQITALQAQVASLQQCIHSFNNLLNLVAQNASKTDINTAAKQIDATCGSSLSG